MYANVQILEVKNHQNLRFLPASDYGFARSLWQAPLALAEILPAALCFPVLFSTEAQVNALALLGKEHNQFVSEQNQWLASYVPVHVQRYPFVLGREKTASDFLLMADMDAPQFKSQQGEAIFDASGKLNAHFQPVVKLMLEFEAGRQSSVLQLLAEKEVLVPRSLFKRVGEQQVAIGQYRVVDQDKLAALDDATLATWTRNGLMRLIDAHLLSLRHLDVMLQA
ncbi:SapC family protein [Undibacterium baiyunense]|uniref:SapC family protein n=1 Tax=Undibacterium baiyunense TaxID=2828731 RepID=A0A941DHF9_9BURK|nr:SapC family protein [Undibacterium baiyunense]MBR7747991.1 SapC family protein [Undibacterium baiyunense]